ncbi:hydantoinase B/oxoprolinase family protein [Paralcaligenes ureilyticus]|uniref:N-methylhydantoinase B n=1 Tax=Paralcaligenes ureilyticus TaxID=627131 RepID=A0A4R3LRG7_9BURK|nr:hydantoinase B/oxoprolinase family protein [Paralcaligenes ureilyticus]TCT03072.1 N-methylhydantoinase B [Paralcaligenes ureilyticus]
MKFSKAELQIFADYCTAIAESMAFTLIRTAHSTFIKETEDFSCALVTLDGLTFASPKTLGATWYTGLDYGPLVRSIKNYEPGDIYMSNDPYSGYVATHTPDVVMWKPVFFENRIVCFVAGHIHNTDMGGAVPASLSRSLIEIHQEGIRFPPSRIVKAGEVNQELLSWMLLNVRAPDQNRGDLLAQVASLGTGEKRILEIIEKFGCEAFSTGMQQLLDYAESQARSVVQAIPDGEYFFSEYADEDSVDGEPLRIALRLVVRNDSLVFDFSESDPQLASSLNVPTGGHPRHALLLIGLSYVLYCLDSNVLLNSGTLRVASCIAPEGSVLNPVQPAAVGMRSLTCVIVQAAVFGAFSRAIPEKMPACPASSIPLLNVKTTDRLGHPVMASIGPVGGGAGGSSSGDGSDASGANLAFLRNTPVEVNESEVPILITEYHLVPDSGGPGEFRGGLGLMMEFQVFAPGTLVTARNRDRTRFGSWGIKGGEAGRTSSFVRNPGSSNMEDLGNTDLVNCEPGDVIRLEGNGGGGYGSPLLRPVADVLDDVQKGYVSLECARTAYGVVIEANAVNDTATSNLRKSLTPSHSDRNFYGYCKNRLSHESVWTQPCYAKLMDCLASVPVNWRFFLKHLMFAEMRKQVLDDGASPTPELVKTIYGELCSQYPSVAVSASA